MRPARGVLAAVALAAGGMLAGCGGDEQEGSNTVAGCQAAAVRAIVAGDLSDSGKEGEDYPECEGLSEDDLGLAFEGAFADPAVEQAMIDIVEKGVDGIETDFGPPPTAPPEPSATPSPG